MGEGIASETRNEIASLVEQDVCVIKTKNILSTYQSPEDVILMLIIDFKDHLNTEDITEAINRIRTTIKTEFKFIHYVIIQPEQIGLDMPFISYIKYTANWFYFAQVY